MPITIEDTISTDQKRRQSNNGCFGWNKIRHFMEDCPKNSNNKKGRRKKGLVLTIKPWDDTSSKEET
jgi:hypothetical protein